MTGNRSASIGTVRSLLPFPRDVDHRAATGGRADITDIGSA
jgi:hypothetical protein